MQKSIASIQPPSWGRIHFADNVPVRLDQEWLAAVTEVDPDKDGESAHYQMRHLYPPIGSGTVVANLVLVNLAGGTYQQALDWAAQCNLSQSTPRHVFALAKHDPKIHIQLGLAYPRIISSEGRMYVGGDGGTFLCYVSFFPLGRCGVGAFPAITLARPSSGAWVAFLRG